LLDIWCDDCNDKGDGLLNGEMTLLPSDVSEVMLMSVESTSSAGPT